MTTPTSAGKYLIIHFKYNWWELTVILPDPFFRLQGLQMKPCSGFLVMRESRIRQCGLPEMEVRNLFEPISLRQTTSVWSSYLCYTKTLSKKDNLQWVPPPSAAHWPLPLPVPRSGQVKLLGLSRGATVSLLSWHRVHVITGEEMPPGCGMTVALGLLMLLLPATSLAQSGDGESVNMGEEAVSGHFHKNESGCSITWQYLLLQVYEMK